VEEEAGSAADYYEYQVTRAVRSGLDVSEPVPVAHFFSSPGRYPNETIDALKKVKVSRIVTTEESVGDNYWHVAAFTMQAIGRSDVELAQDLMKKIASLTAVRYDGWKVSLTIAQEQALQ
jgi:hypothetical protein